MYVYMAEVIVKRKIIKKQKKKKKKKVKGIAQKQKQRQNVTVNVYTSNRVNGNKSNKPLSLARQKQKDNVSALTLGRSNVASQPLSIGSYSPSSNYFELEQRVQRGISQMELMNRQVQEAEKRRNLRESAEQRRAYENAQLIRLDTTPKSIGLGVEDLESPERDADESSIPNPDESSIPNPIIFTPEAAKELPSPSEQRRESYDTAQTRKLDSTGRDTRGDLDPISNPPTEPPRQRQGEAAAEVRDSMYRESQKRKIPHLQRRLILSRISAEAAEEPPPSPKTTPRRRRRPDFYSPS